MTTATKKITSLLLLLSGLMPLVIVLCMTVKQQLIRQHMKEKLEQEQELQTITIPENEIVWMDKHEIWVNEKMFDIAEVSVKNGIYTFTGLYDIAETELVQLQRNVIPLEKEETEELASLFETFYNLFYHTGESPYLLKSGSSSLLVFDSPKPASFYKTILTPPPQML